MALQPNSNDRRIDRMATSVTWRYTHYALLSFLLIKTQQVRVFPWFNKKTRLRIGRKRDDSQFSFLHFHVKDQRQKRNIVVSVKTGFPVYLFIARFVEYNREYVFVLYGIV